MTDSNGQNASVPQHCISTKDLPLLVLARPHHAHQERQSSFSGKLVERVFLVEVVKKMLFGRSKIFVFFFHHEQKEVK